MSLPKIRPLPSVEEVLAGEPLDAGLASVKEARDRMVRAVLTHADHRFLVIAGPCSAHDEAAVCDYVGRLAKVQEAVRERVVIITRIYTTKPRTTGTAIRAWCTSPTIAAAQTWPTGSGP